MALPNPRPGLVIRYDYVWSHEAAAGRTQGKDRPACLVAGADSESAPRFVVILPITHRAPAGSTIGIEIPARIRSALGLDEEPCWVIVSESNIDEWPNPGLTPIPGRPGIFSCGFLPPLLFERIKTRYLEVREQSRGSPVRR